MFVYTMQPVVQPVVQRFDNRLYRVNGVLGSNDYASKHVEIAYV